MDAGAGADSGGRGGDVAAAAAEGDGAPEVLRFYRRQSRITDPGTHAPLLDALSHDVPSLCRLVRGLILHPITAHLYGVRVPEARLGEQDTRRVAAMLARILELDGRDVAALNGVELLSWDVWGLAHATEAATDPAELALLDRLAALTRSDTGRSGELRCLYESDPRLRVPPVVTSFLAAGGWRTAQEVSPWTA